MDQHAKRLNLHSLITRFLILFCIIIPIILIIINLGAYQGTNLILLWISIIFLCAGITISIIFISKINNKDTLTKIYNMDGFTFKLVILMVQKRLHNYTSIFMNICDVKYINRVATSAGGDRMLYLYAQKLKAFTDGGEVVARLGGDNFIALVKKERAQKFIDMLGDIRISLPVNEEDHPFLIKTRSGLYDICEGDTPNDAINNASIAFNSVRNFRDTTHLWFEESMAKEAYLDKEVSIHFLDALKNDEFIVHYQPKVDAVSNTLTGTEALVRWVRNGEIVNPIKFIPSLERAGFITQLDFYVFEQVCKDINSWVEQGLTPVPVSSNFSKLHLRNPFFAENILYLLSRYNIDPTLIEIELTESAGFEDYDTFRQFLKQMHDAGIKVAIDDFGVGYSSLDFLKDDNVTVVKIDKSFIDNIEVDNGDNVNAKFMSNITQICHAMNKQIVCEGVEREDQREILLAMNCNEIQGFLYDKPLPKSEFEKRLASPDYR